MPSPQSISNEATLNFFKTIAYSKIDFPSLNRLSPFTDGNLKYFYNNLHKYSFESSNELRFLNGSFEFNAKTGTFNITLNNSTKILYPVNFA